jgi:hypothetical protein
MKNLITFAFLSVQILSYGQDTLKSKTRFMWQSSLNSTLDKSIVKRLIIISNNRMLIESKNARFEPVLNYRFGYVQPNGRPKTDLENDVFAQLESHFKPRKKVFPSLILSFENSPNLRQLNQRYVAGLGLGTMLSKKQSHISQFNLYGLYEQSKLKELDYKVFRIFPSLKGRVSTNQNKLGLVYSGSVGIATSNGENMRLRAFVKPYVKLNKSLEFNLMYDLWHENIVSGTSPKEISTFTMGLSFSK